MKWITRENIKVDRVACPWLIRRFIDPQAQFLFVARAYSSKLPRVKMQSLSTHRGFQK